MNFDRWIEPLTFDFLNVHNLLQMVENSLIRWINSLSLRLVLIPVFYSLLILFQSPTHSFPLSPQYLISSYISINISLWIHPHSSILIHFHLSAPLPFQPFFFSEEFASILFLLLSSFLISKWLLANRRCNPKVVDN